MKKIAITIFTLAFIYFGINVSVKGIAPQTDTFEAIDCSSLNHIIENEPKQSDWVINHYDYKVYNPINRLKLARLFSSHQHEPEDARYFITIGFLGLSESRCFDAGYKGQDLHLEVSRYITDRLSNDIKTLKREYGLAK